MQKYAKVFAAIAFAAVLVAGCKGYQLSGRPYQPPQTAPAISGLNWDGSQFNLSQLEGKPILLFFGYTNCPDVCPTTLAEWKQLRQNLGSKADNIAFVYVSVDPERDTVARLKEFIPQFDPAFYGIHVNSIELETIKEGYGVVAEKVYTDPNNRAAGYSIDHTARTYLIGPKGRLATSYPYGTDIASIQKDIEYLIR